MLSFDNEQHQYKWGSKIVPSVTQVMSRVAVTTGDGFPFVPIADHRFAKDERAAKFGTALHKCAEHLIHGVEFEAQEELKPWINGVEKFLSDYEDLRSYNGRPDVAVENAMYSQRYGYAGTPDWIAEDPNGNVYVIDWKTSTAFQKYWRLQTAAYAQLIQENFGIRKKIVRISVQIFEGGYEIDKRKTEPDFNKFLSILNVYKMAA